jgi:hypothetical protein
MSGISARLIGLFLILGAPGIGSALAQGDIPPLGAYNAAIMESSISGISSGAFMAVQFGVSWSSAVRGVGIIAGGPYYCAQGTAAEGLSGNLLSDLVATGPCMKGPPPALGSLFEKADEWSSSGDIDDIRNLAHQKIYIFSGYNDAIVNPEIGDSVYQFYLHYLRDQNKGNLFYQNAIGAGHSQVTWITVSPASITRITSLTDVIMTKPGFFFSKSMAHSTPRTRASFRASWLRSISGSSPFRSPPAPTAWPRPGMSMCLPSVPPSSRAGFMSHSTAASRILTLSATAIPDMPATMSGPTQTS